MIVAEQCSLDNLTAFGVDYMLSDSRWLGPSDAKVCHTGALIQNCAGIYKPVGCSFSSTESSATASRFAIAMHRCRRCSPQCQHPLEMVSTADITRLSWIRRCTSSDDGTILKKYVKQLTSIDKDAAAKKGFQGRVAVDIFHHMKAFGSKMKEYGLTNGSVLAGVNQLHRVTLRY